LFLKRTINSMIIMSLSLSLSLSLLLPLSLSLFPLGHTISSLRSLTPLLLPR
jgi:hypothetical protein